MIKYKKFRIFYFILLSLIFIKIIYIYFIYNIIVNKLDNYNNNNIKIYSKIINIEINKEYNKNEIIKILNLSRYRLKNKVKKPGDYFISDNKIDLFLRHFNFLDLYENKKHVIINFDKNIIKSIFDVKNNCYIKNIRLDPQIINFCNKNNKYKLFKSIINFPKTLINILIMIEDKNFYNHKGINIFSIFRAIIKNIINRRIVEGGSTITQQLVKNMFLSNKKSFLRKFNEIFMSIIIDYKYSKDKILELYLNEVYFGIIEKKEIYGFPLASICYFNTPINELSINQQIILISMLKGASLYNPYKNIKLLINRKNFILKKMLTNNFIDNSSYNFLLNEKIIINKKISIINYPSFINILKRDIKNLGYDFYKCKKIFSTLDLISQKSLHKSSNLLKNIIRNKKNNKNVETSIIVVDYKKGEIKSSIGGFDNQYYGLNRIYSKRQVGSIIKPLIYLYALSKRKKYQLNTFLLDKPIFYKQDNYKIWFPKNDNKKFRGKSTLMYSLIYSLNIPTINLGFNLGIENIINIIKSLTNINNINKFPSIFLGAIDLNLIEVSQIYQTIANSGIFIKIKSVDSILINSKIINFVNKKNIFFKKEPCYLLMYCLKQVTKIGTASKLNKFKNLDIAGKTGTTNNYKDIWFVGIDNNNICVIWTGNDNNSPNVYKNSSLDIYEEYLKNNFINSIKIDKPKDIYYINLDKFNNLICNNHYCNFKIPVWIENPINIFKNCPNHSIFIRYFRKIFNIF